MTDKQVDSENENSRRINEDAIQDKPSAVYKSPNKQPSENLECSVEIHQYKKNVYEIYCRYL